MNAEKSILKSEMKRGNTMYNFKTISDDKILSLAVGALLQQWEKEMDRKKRLNDQGKASPIADYRLEQLNMQIAELSKKQIELERHPV